MNAVPLIRLEVEYMKQAIVHAFGDYQLQMDTQLREAVAKVCHPNNLQQVLDREVRCTLEASIKRELDHFFQFGDGKNVVRDAVRTAIKAKYKDVRKQKGRT